MNELSEQAKTTSTLRTLQQRTIIAWHKLINRLDSYAEQYSEYRRSKNAIRELAELDNRMLKDIGIDRADVIRVAMADDPGGELECLNNGVTKNNKRRRGLRILPTNRPHPPSTICCEL